MMYVAIDTPAPTAYQNARLDTLASVLPDQFSFAVCAEGDVAGRRGSWKALGHDLVHSSAGEQHAPGAVRGWIEQPQAILRRPHQYATAGAASFWGKASLARLLSLS